MQQHVSVVVRQVNDQRGRELDRHFVEQRALLVIRHGHEKVGSGRGPELLQLFDERRPLASHQQIAQFLRLLTIHRGTQEPTTFSRRLRRPARPFCARVLRKCDRRSCALFRRARSSCVYPGCAGIYIFLTSARRNGDISAPPHSHPCSPKAPVATNEARRADLDKKKRRSPHAAPIFKQSEKR